MKAREFDAVIAKLQFAVRDTGDIRAYLWIDGKKAISTRRSHGSGDVPCEHLIRQQLKVDENQMRGLIACSFSRDQYLEHLKSRGII